MRSKSSKSESDFKPAPPPPHELPALDRPAPQPWNQIAPTFEEQLQRALGPRPTPDAQAAEQFAALLREHAEMLTPVILEIIARPLGTIVGHVVEKQLASRREHDATGGAA